MNQEATSSRDKVSSEVFIGVCEMETDIWACGTCSTVYGHHVRIGDGHQMEYRYVCSDCVQRFGERK